MFLHHNKNKRRSAFTLMEILIVVALISILAVSSLPIYGNFQGTAQLNETSAMLVQTVRQARELSFVRFSNTNYGVKFLPSSYILYQGTSYASRTTSTDQVFALATSLSLTTTLSNNEVNFSRGVGAPNSNGSVLLQNINLGTKTILINSAGMITLQ